MHLIKPAWPMHRQGSQNTGAHLRDFLKQQDIVCRMSRAGEVWHNSAMESPFNLMKTERTAHKG